MTAAHGDIGRAGLHVEVGSGDRQECGRCGRTASRSPELVDGNGAVLAQVPRCGRCANRHRERDRS